MLIKTNTRKDIVRQQKQIIDHVSRRSESGEQGESPNMTDCFVDFDKTVHQLKKSGSVTR